MIELRFSHFYSLCLLHRVAIYFLFNKFHLFLLLITQQHHQQTPRTAHMKASFTIKNCLERKIYCSLRARQSSQRGELFFNSNNFFNHSHGNSNTFFDRKCLEQFSSHTNFRTSVCEMMMMMMFNSIIQ